MTGMDKPKEALKEDCQRVETEATEVQTVEMDLETLKQSDNITPGGQPIKKGDLDKDANVKPTAEDEDKLAINNVDNNNTKAETKELDSRYTNPAFLENHNDSRSKKKKKPKAPKPTGFEDYYVEAPLTPAEYNEEQDLFSPNKPFSERYLLAIARYTKRRRFDEFRLNVFDKYMSYSGIGAGVKAFQGKVEEKDPEMTSVDAAILKSKYALKHDTLETSVVDFDGVFRGFISSYLPTVQELHRPEQFKACTNVIRNFLNYLLYHDVCPEYADQIYEAKKSCDQSDIQLPMCSRLTGLLPGTFNKACSILFGGYYQDLYIEDVEHMKALNITPGMRREEAVKIFLAGLAAFGTESMVEMYNVQASNDEIKLKQQFDGHLEVISVQPPPTNVLELYELASQRGIHPVGTVKFLNWRHPGGSIPQMAPEEVGKWKVAPYERKEYQMLVDIDLLPLIKVGTKLACSWRETSFGLWYFDGIMSVLSPMYTWLQNEPMMDWVTPKMLAWRPRASQDDYSEGIMAEVGYDNHVAQDDKKDAGETKAPMKNEEKKDGDSDEDIPAEYKHFEKGEDIFLSI